MSSAPQERGQSLVEFALGAIVFFTLVFGILEFGRAIYTYSVVANAAREGARRGAILQTQGAIEDAVGDRAVGLDRARISVDPFEVMDGQVVVRVTYTFRPVAPLISAIVPEIPMSSEARQFRETWEVGP